MAAQPPHLNHFTAAQLVLLKELATVVLYYSILPNFNTGCISFLNTVLSVKIHYSCTHKWSLPVLSLPLLLQAWHRHRHPALEFVMYSCVCFQSSHSQLMHKDKNYAVIYLDTRVITINKKSLTILLAEGTRFVLKASQLSHLTSVVHTQFCAA